MTTALSASATTRMREALGSWAPEASSFPYHLYLLGQDAAFAEILNWLDQVARGANPSYGDWRTLERAFDQERDYKGTVALIEQALGQPVA